MASKVVSSLQELPCPLKKSCNRVSENPATGTHGGGRRLRYSFIDLMALEEEF